ncbi:MAG: DNA/RNA non-specific endonuclease [Gemmatimonadota bacterium]
MRRPTFALALLALALACLFAAPLEGQHPEIHAKHFLHGYPTGVPETNDLVVRDVYALSSNDGRRMADWVAYRLTHRTVDGPALSRRWRVDPWLEPEERLDPRDYLGAHDELGVDRGHLAPLAAFRGTLAGHQTNYLSNVTPQRSALNQGPWRRMEEAVRDLARQDTVHVMTGPLFERDMPELPEAGDPHAVPSGFWKIVAMDASGGPRVMAVVMEQEIARDADYCDRRVSVDEIEARSGLDFFWELDAEREEALEDDRGSEELAGRLGC